MGQTSIPCSTAVRDELADDKPENASWSEYLSALHQQQLPELLDAGTGPETDELAREVAATIDYAQLATKVADELEGRMR